VPPHDSESVTRKPSGGHLGETSSAPNRPGNGSFPPSGTPTQLPEARFAETNHCPFGIMGFF